MKTKWVWSWNIHILTIQPPPYRLQYLAFALISGGKEIGSCQCYPDVPEPATVLSGVRPDYFKREKPIVHCGSEFIPNKADLKIGIAFRTQMHVGGLLPREGHYHTMEFLTIWTPKQNVVTKLTCKGTLRLYLQSINSDKNLPQSQFNFFRWQHFALVSI